MRIQNKMNNDENILWQGRMALIKVLMCAFLNETLILLNFIWSISALFLKVYQTSKLGLICNAVYADTCRHISV